MLAVHDQFHYVGSRHLWKLLRDDVFQVYQMSHVFKCSVKSNEIMLKVLYEINKLLLVILVTESEHLLIIFDDLKSQQT